MGRSQRSMVDIFFLLKEKMKQNPAYKLAFFFYSEFISESKNYKFLTNSPQINSAAVPSPYNFGNLKSVFECKVSKADLILFSSASATIAAPQLTSSTHSVSGRRITQGFSK